MNLKGKLIQLFKDLYNVHYLTNVLLCSSYYLLKNIPYVCDTIFETCILEWREWEILILLMIFVSVKSRKATTLIQYLSTICTFGKAANVILYWREGTIYAFLFCFMWFLHVVFVPQPVYRGPENVKYFRGVHLEHEIKSDDRITWLVCYFTNWSPPSIDFASVFAELSNKYGDLDNFKFAKLDLNPFPEVAKRLNISTSSLSKQLPTLILYQKGVETKRRPFIDSQERVFPFVFSFENVVKEFDLNTVYYECKKNPIVVRPINKQEPKAAAEVSAGDKKTN